jgi:hypothetical protein
LLLAGRRLLLRCPSPPPLRSTQFLSTFRRHLAIRKKNGKRVKLKLQDAALAAQLRSGAKVQASGRWVNLAGLEVDDDDGGEPTRFVASGLRDVGPKWAPPERERLGAGCMGRGARPCTSRPLGAR